MVIESFCLMLWGAFAYVFPLKIRYCGFSCFKDLHLKYDFRVQAGA